MMLTGAKVKMVQQCSGIDGMWGFRAENEDISIPIAKKLGDMITEADGDAVAGDCHLANTAIMEQTGGAARHPLQVIARALRHPGRALSLTMSRPALEDIMDVRQYARSRADF